MKDAAAATEVALILTNYNNANTLFCGLWDGGCNASCFAGNNTTGTLSPQKNLPCIIACPHKPVDGVVTIEEQNGFCVPLELR